MPTLKTNIADLKILSENTVEIKIHEDVELNLENVKQTFEQIRTYNNAKKIKIILDLRTIQFSHIPSEVMEFMADSEYNDCQIAIAFIIEGLGQKLLANFYLKVVKPVVQSKVFTNYNEAYKWIESINENQIA